MTDTIQQADERPGADGANESPLDAHMSDGGGQARRHTALFVAGLVALAGGIPLAVALTVLRQPRWYPLLDLAQTELRVRDVGGGHPPLVGLAGRIQGFGKQGSHPGPISFWALWPFYKLFGSSSWALQAASASLNLLAMTVSVWIAHRRGGRTAALVCALTLAVLVRSYGADKLTEAWNPYMPMLWWVVVLLAVWSVLCDDLAMLPVATFAATFCMQTHIPYAGLVGGVGLFTVAAVAVTVFLRRRGDSDDRDPDQAATRAQVVRWGLGSLVLLLLLWIPPIIDQLTNDPGNLSLIKETFTNSEDDAVGLRGYTLRLWLAHLNPGTLISGTSGGNAQATASNLLPGVGLLAAWAAAVVVAWHTQARELLRLHLVVGVALVLGLISISRILGFVWYYLLLWAWGTTALLLAATAWTFVVAFWQRSASDTSKSSAARARQLLIAPLAVSLVAVSAWFTYDAAHTEVPAAVESRTLRHLVPDTVAALQQGDGVGGGEDGRYLLDWGSDEASIGSQGFGFLLALERAGLDVGAPEFHSTGAVEHRVLAPADATAVVHYVVGPGGIESWRDTPDATEVAYYEPRTDEQVARFDELHDEVVADYRAADLDDLATRLDGNLLATAMDERTPPDVLPKIQEMLSLGLPAAVFVTPVGTTPAG